MKKITSVGLMSVLIIFIVLLNSCQASKLEAEKTKEKELKTIVERSIVGGSLPAKYGLLSDIQVTACNTAHEAGTCDTRLAELGVVLKEDCCEALGKCC